MKTLRQITALILVVSVFSSTFVYPIEAEAAKPGCKASVSSLLKILWTGLKTSQNVFPIRLAGIKIFSFSGVDDYDTSGASSMPLCFCKMPPPIFLRIGLKFSMWEAAHIVESVKHPWCSPTAGLEIPVPFNTKDVGMSSTKTSVSGRAVSASAQEHLVIYPIWTIVGLFLDIACFQFARSFDYLYLTEVDPLWQNDMWATLLGPEAFLVSNPITQIACTADSVAANTVRAIDPLFWCVGSWSTSVYPMSKNQQSSGDYVAANAALAARLAAKLHREFLLWGTIGPPMVSGVCQRYPAPMWIKRQYNLLLLWPVSQNKRMQIGRTGLMWSFGKNPPWKTDDFVFMLYNKRDCCLF